MKIRPARVEDAAGIAEVHVRGWQDAYRDIYSAEYLASLSVVEREKSWVEWIGKGDPAHTTTLVAEDAGKITGFINIGRYRQDKSVSGDGEINALYVMPELKGKGIGTALLNEGFSWFRKCGRSNVYVETSKSNPYGHFYAKNGGVLQDNILTRESGGRTVEMIAFRWSI